MKEDFDVTSFILRFIGGLFLAILIVHVGVSLICHFTIHASAASLYDVEDPESPWYTEEKTEYSGYEFPNYAIDEDGDLLINADTSLSDVLGSDSESDASVSGGDFDEPLPERAVTYADVENIVEEAFADSRLTNLSIADAYLSSSIVDVFSRVVDGYPSHYKYAAYRTNATDGNEGYLLIGSKAKVNGNYLEFPSGSQLVHYYRTSYNSGYQTYYLYKYDVSDLYDTYRLPYTGGQLIYTNMVSGYPVLSEHGQNYFASIVLPVFIVIVAFFIIFRRKK